MKAIEKARRIETLAVLALACAVLALARYRREGLSWSENGWLVAAVAFLAIGCFIPALGGLITRAWFGLSRFLGSVMLRVVLCCVFFALLLPLSWIRRLFERDPLRLKKGGASYFTDAGKSYAPVDLKHPW